ncbi:MAG: serine hydrolase, partial [Cyanobacteria bacterium P01_F01_bin.116]
FTRSYGLANHEHSIANTPDTKFRIGSITKQFTAVAILQLQEQGLIDVYAPISTYLPDYPQGDVITIHHLLTHTSGIPEYLNGETFPDIIEWMRLPSTLEQLVERFQNLPLEFTPGEQFKYSNSGYVLLTQILETISGQPYADYMQTNIFTLLGMNNTGYEIPKAVIPNLAQGYVFIGKDLYLQAEPIDMSLPQGAGGLYSTLDDLNRWHQWLYGTPRLTPTQPILSDASITLLTTSVVKMDTPEDYPDTFYSYGFVNDTHLARRRIHHNGGINGFRSSLMYYPEENLTISVLLNLENQAPEAIAEGIAAILFGEPYSLPKVHTPITLDPVLYEKYVGTYQLLPELQVNLWVEENQLIGQATGQEAFTLYPTSETEFFATVVELTVDFSVEDDGTVAGFTLHQLGNDIFAPKID